MMHQFIKNVLGRSSDFGFLYKRPVKRHYVLQMDWMFKVLIREVHEPYRSVLHVVPRPNLPGRLYLHTKSGHKEMFRNTFLSRFSKSLRD